MEREQHTSALMSKWSGLEDEAMTRETQTPGWSGTKQECSLDGRAANVLSAVGVYCIEFIIL